MATKRFCYYFCAIMLGIDTKREIITGKFARRIWSEVLAMWFKEGTIQAGDNNQQYEVEWL